MLRASTTCPRSRTIRRLYRLPSIYTTTIHDSYSLPSLPSLPPPAVVVFLPPRSSSLLPSHLSFCPSFWHALIPSPPPSGYYYHHHHHRRRRRLRPSAGLLFLFPLRTLSFSRSSFTSTPSFPRSYAFPLRRGTSASFSFSCAAPPLRVSLPSPPNDIREHERS